ncbi:MAG: PadR family transcriptional regulator, partial [Nocardioidaceae bacterium]
MTKRGGAVEMAVLGLLHESPMHGYELRKRVSTLLGWGRVLSYGSLYPALKQMRRAGWLTEDVPAPDQAVPSADAAPEGAAAVKPASRRAAARAGAGKT